MAILSLNFADTATLITLIVICMITCIVVSVKLWRKSRDKHDNHPTERSSVQMVSPTQQILSNVIQTKVSAEDEIAPPPPEFDVLPPPPSDEKPTTKQVAPRDMRITLASFINEDEENWYSLNYTELEMISKIGEGSFGIVYKARWRDEEVAVKTLKQADDARRQAFIREASLMITIKPHKNIVKLYGICHFKNQPLAIVTEFLELGSLKELLINYESTNKKKLSFLQIVSMSRDVARGLQHLHKEKIVHRDLSARNILLTMDKGEYLCKVADFGLSRATESGVGFTQSTTGPLRWMAPESLLSKEYSEKSDIWAYGCTIIEILNEGKDPYYEEPEAIKVAAAVMLESQRPSIPDNTPLKLTKVLEACFSRKPADRPDFKQILEVLNDVEHDIKANPFY